MKYKIDYELQEKMEEIIGKLGMYHVKKDDVICIRSQGTSTSRTIARCHALGKVMQLALNRKAMYVLEFLSERFDKLSEKDQTKTIIHELMHIPKSFGGGFIYHNFVTEKNVDLLYQKLMGCY
ncbi:MAG: putative metallopeptidase [Candidatus Pacearchaeota archaeon]|nr:putative metallopeptidase [Candidatus Pacearchaeota archaeon]